MLAHQLVQRAGAAEQLTQSSGHQSFQCQSRQPLTTASRYIGRSRIALIRIAERPGFAGGSEVPLPCHEAVRDVVAIAQATLERVARRQPLTLCIVDEASQQAWSVRRSSAVALDPVLRQDCLYCSKQLGIDDRCVLAGIALPLCTTSPR